MDSVQPNGGAPYRRYSNSSLCSSAVKPQLKIHTESFEGQNTKKEEALKLLNTFYRSLFYHTCESVVIWTEIEIDRF